MPQLMSTAPQEAPQDETVQLLAVLRRGKWWFLACVLILPTLIYFYSERLPKTYTAATTVAVGSSLIDTSLFNEQTRPAINSIARVARLTSTSVVAREAAQRYLQNPPPNPSSLLGQITVSADQETELITITAVDAQPGRAADIANAFGQTLVGRRKRAAIDQVSRAVSTVKDNLDRLPRSDPEGRRQLSQELQRLRAVRAAQGNNSSIIEPAVAPGAASSPNPRRNATLAFIVAVLLGLALVTLIDRLDRRIREPGEMEDLLGAPLLATVPRDAFPGQKPSPSAFEAFGTLRTSLTYFNIDRRLKTVVITSGFKEDGKTTVTAGLVLAAARTGRKVIAVDTDLRRGQLASRLGVTAEYGLSDVLVGERSVFSALIEVPGSMGLLRVLPAGPVPPNPSELIGSQQMRELLETLAGLADLVVIDTSPLLIVSDAIPLLEQTSGTVVVGRLNQSTRDGLRRLRQILVTARSTVLGVVATNAKPGSTSRDGYGYESYHRLPEATETAAAPANGAAAPNGSADHQPAPAGDPVAAGDGPAKRGRLRRPGKRA